MAQLFSLGHETVFGFGWLVGLAVVRIEMREHSTVRSGSARAGSGGGQVRSLPLGESLDLLCFY